jgi:hypothetical protein
VTLLSGGLTAAGATPVQACTYKCMSLILSPRSIVSALTKFACSVLI